jgi:Tfp pilus assembly PilM family ATPase
VNGLEFVKASWLYVEIGQHSMKVVNGEAALDFPLDRQENGRLTNPCREQLTRTLQESLQRKPWQPRLRALCAIGARGVSLRRLSLPAAAKDELPRLLRLQIESEFPLPPEQLAWGYRQLKQRNGPPTAKALQELVVVAVKKEFIEEYSEVLSECGVNPVFTLAVLTRSRISPPPQGAHAVLEIGLTHSEWVSFENGAPNALRILPWGKDNITRAIERCLGISRDEAERLANSPASNNTSDPESGQKVRHAVEAELDSLVADIRPIWTGQKIFLTGTSARELDLAPRLVNRLGQGAACEQREPGPDDGRSAAILALEKAGAQDGDSAPLLIQLNEAKGGETLARPAPWKWAALAVLLAVGLVSLPYAEALLMKSRLSGRLAALKVEKERLPAIDKELRFLQYLKDNQPPYLEALTIVANAAQPGTRFDAVSMNRRGDLSLRGFMRDSQQVVDFRAKLIKSGFFANVVVEEQNPTPDRQRINLRISAQWKPAPGRESPPFAPAAPEIDKPKGIVKDLKSNAPPERAAVGPAAVGATTPGPVAPAPPTATTNPAPTAGTNPPPPTQLKQ